MKSITLLALTLMVTGCTSYGSYNPYGTYHGAYTSQVTTNAYITAPSYITSPEGFVESAPGATIYYGRTAPETVYQGSSPALIYRTR